MEAAAVTEDFAVRNHRSIGLHPLDVVQGEAVLNLEGDVSAPDVTIAFADLAGFTALSDEASIEELGRVAGRFEDLVTDVAAPPVRLVEVLGDGAMLVCAEPDPLVRSMLDLVDAAAAEEYLPPVHAGVAHGPALHSAGDWLGRTVWEDAGAYDLRGISEPVPALRAGTPPSRSSAAPRDHPRPPSARSR